MAAIIGDFGKDDNGVNLYRLNGTKDEIQKALEDLKKLGCDVWEPFEWEKSHKHWSKLVKVKIPIETKDDANEKTIS